MSGSEIKVDGAQTEFANLPAQARFLAAISQLNGGVLLSLKKLSEAQTRPPTKRELKVWARRWHIEADWVVEWAAHTVRWQRRGPNKRWERFYHSLWSPTSRFERRPPTIDVAIKRRVAAFDFSDWLGDPSTKSEVRLQAARAFQEILKKAVSRIVRISAIEKIKLRVQSVSEE